MKGKILRPIIPIFVLLLQAHFSMSQKTDKVYLKNGDILTGEIMSMKLAMLTYKMDGPGTISIKWEDVIRFKSDKIFEITLKWGTIVVARADSTFYEQYHATINDIVEIIPIKDKFLRRLIGDFNLGFNYSKSSQVLQFNVNLNTTYKIPTWEFGIKFNNVVTDNGIDSTVTKKQDASFSIMKDLDKRFYVGTTLGWQQNTELGLNNRFSLAGAVGLITISDNHNRMLVATGLSVNTEQSVQSSTYTTNLDAVATVGYKRFYYNSPKLTINADLTTYPSLTDWGRVRLDGSLYVYVEIFKDFTIGMNFYDTYDSRPPQGALSKNDYGINLTIGYIFGK
jgi:Protein of unknown function, DUF481